MQTPDSDDYTTLNDRFKYQPPPAQTPQVQPGQPASGSKINRSALIDGTGTFDWRRAMFAVAILAIAFTFTMSVTGIITMATALSLNILITTALCVSVSSAELVIVVWLFAPQARLMSKKQETWLRFGSYGIMLLQVIEVGLTMAYMILGGSKVFLWSSVVVTVLMVLTALAVAKSVIQYSKTRQIALEETDTDIEQTIARVQIRTMKARQELLEMKSIIDVENALIKAEKVNALNALNSQDARNGVKEIGATRVKAVIEAMKIARSNYGLKILAEAGTSNAPVNPARLNGSSGKK